MDTITHIVLGACLGEAIAGKKIGKKAMLFGALANNIPDADIISYAWETEVGGLLAHRGFTHSILFAILISLLLAYIFTKWKKYPEVSFARWLALFGIGMFTHILIDAFTTYGTGWFEPFSSYRVSFNAMFILDPLFTLPILISAFLLLILHSKSKYRNAIVNIGLGLSAFYLFAVSVNKYHINELVKENFEKQEIAYDDYFSTPAPLTNLLWYTVAKDKESYHVAYYSIFDSKKDLDFYSGLRNDSLLDPYRSSSEVQKLIRFSKGFYAIHPLDGSIGFGDMRFGQLEGWKKRDAQFLFKYEIKKGETDVLAIQQARFEGFPDGIFKNLYFRICGN